ncbi:MAG TPA: serine hydrolase domain-containing protein, partial [Acidobacteriota bacterium]
MIFVSMNNLSATKALLIEWTQSRIFPGVALLVRKDGKTMFSFASGKASYNPDVAASVDHIWVVASISKPVATAALLQLVDRGLVRLQQRVKDFLPEFHHDRVLIRHLLTHTSGLGAMEPDEGIIREKGRIRAIADQKLLFEPGTKCSYSTPSFDLIEKIVCDLSGLNWVDYTKCNLFDPLQMNLTSYQLEADWKGQIATVYDPEDRVDPWWNRASLRDIGLAGGGMFSTLNDLASFAQVFLSEGAPILTPESCREMIRLQTPGLFNLEGRVQTWGLGWYLNQDREEGSGFGPLSQQSFAHGG